MADDIEASSMDLVTIRFGGGLTVIDFIESMHASMMPKGRHAFSDDIRLHRIGLDHGHVFGSVGSKDIVI